MPWATSYAGHFAHEREFPISHEFICAIHGQTQMTARDVTVRVNGWSIHNRKVPGSFLSATRSIAYDEEFPIISLGILVYEPNQSRRQYVTQLRPAGSLRFTEDRFTLSDILLLDWFGFNIPVFL